MENHLKKSWKVLEFDFAVSVATLGKKGLECSFKTNQIMNSATSAFLVCNILVERFLGYKQLDCDGSTSIQCSKSFFQKKKKKKNKIFYQLDR